MRPFHLASLLVALPLAACTDKAGDTGGFIDPGLVDEDGDGLDLNTESELGTDPTLADTDGDGWSDGEEVDLGTDPLNRFSWDYGSGRWPDFSAEAEAAGVAGTAWDTDEVFPDFTATDQFEQEIHLYQFYGYVILIDFSAGWCGPCRDVAEGAEEWWEEYREDGFLIIHAIIDNNFGTGNVSETFIQGWAEQYDLEFPVVMAGNDTEPNDAYLELYNSGVNEGYIPFMILLDQDMTLVRAYSGSGLESSISRKVENLLGL